MDTERQAQATEQGLHDRNKLERNKRGAMQQFHFDKSKGSALLRQRISLHLSSVKTTSSKIGLRVLCKWSGLFFGGALAEIYEYTKRTGMIQQSSLT